LHGRLARERRCRPGGRDEVVTAHPGGSYNHPSPLGRPNTPTPLALGRGPIGGEPAPCVPGNITTMIRKHIMHRESPL
jgi:hypothetical protein